MEWIRSTFLYVRAIKNPINYGLAAGMMKEKIEKKLEGNLLFIFFSFRC